MNHSDQLGRVPWHSLSLQNKGDGLIAGEKFERFKLEAVTELLLRVVGILMVCASIFMCVILPIHAGSQVLAVYSLTAACLAAGGLCVFTYGTRGFRRQVTLDLEAGELRLAKLNMHNQTRISRAVRFSDVNALFVERPSIPGGQAKLKLAVEGMKMHLIALSGETRDIEMVHSQLTSAFHCNSEAPQCAENVTPQTA